MPTAVRLLLFEGFLQKNDQFPFKKAWAESLISHRGRNKVQCVNTHFYSTLILYLKVKKEIKSTSYISKLTITDSQVIEREVAIIVVRK